MVFTSAVYYFSRSVLNASKIQTAFKRPMGKNVVLLGVPFDKGQKRKGVGNGPEAMRKIGIKKILEKYCTLEDHGDISYEVEKELPKIENMGDFADIAACQEEVSKHVYDIIKSDKVCLTIGGDHSIGIGTVDGHMKAKQNIALVWVDAHADLNTNLTSYTGNIHGMPVALLAKELLDYWPQLPGMAWQQPTLSLKNLAYIGLRDVDAYERLILDKFDITAFGVEDVEDKGIHRVLDIALKRIDPDNNRSIHVSFDIDALDSLEAPSTGTSVRGGLTLREGIQIVEYCYNTGRMNALDLVEINPQIGSEEDVYKTLSAAVHLLKAACGHSRRGYIPPNIKNIPKKI